MLEKENSLLQARLKALEKNEAPLKEKENKTNPEASTQATPTQATPTRRKKPQEKDEDEDEDEEVDEQIPKRRRFYTWQLQNGTLEYKGPKNKETKASRTSDAFKLWRAREKVRKSNLRNRQNLLLAESEEQSLDNLDYLESLLFS